MPSCWLSFSSSFQADILRGRLPCGVSPHLASEEISDASSSASRGNSIAILFLRTAAIPHSRFPRMYSSISPPLCR
jgi:hypothetical protein